MKNFQVTLVKSVTGATVVTHPAPHNAGDVIALAILAMSEGRVHLYRTRNELKIHEAALFGAYIVGTGGQYDGLLRFDGNKAGFDELREDGSKLATAGLVWDTYGVDACIALTGCSLEVAEAAAKKVDEMLVKGVDLADQDDCCQKQMSVARAIAFFNAHEGEEGEEKLFLDACQFAYAVLERAIRHCVAIEKGRAAEVAEI